MKLFCFVFVLLLSCTAALAVSPSPVAEPRVVQPLDAWALSQSLILQSQAAAQRGDLLGALALADEAALFAPADHHVAAQRLHVRAALARTLPGYARQLVYLCHGRATLNHEADARAEEACQRGISYARAHHKLGRLAAR